MEFLLFFFIIPIIFAGFKWGYQPFADGTRKIDPLKYPTLARAQRITRYKNVNAREREQKFLAKARVQRLQQAITANSNEFHDRRAETRVQQKELHTHWNVQFSDLTKAEDDRKRQKALELRVAQDRADQARVEKIRAREAKIWRESEAKRIAAYKKQRALEIAQEAEDRAIRTAAILKDRLELEAMYESKQNVSWKIANAGGLSAPVETSYEIFDIDFDSNKDSSFGDRKVSLHAVYVRMRANKSSKILANLTQYEKISVDGWTVGEELYGNPIWFHQKPGGDRLAGWIWSGAVNNQSTSGLPRMSDKIRTIDAGMITSGSINASMINSDRISTESRSKNYSKNWYDDTVRKNKLSDKDLISLRREIEDEFSRMTKGDIMSHTAVDRLRFLTDSHDAVVEEQDRRTPMRSFHPPKKFGKMEFSSPDTYQPYGHNG